MRHMRKAFTGSLKSESTKPRQILLLLLKFGADPTSKDSNGKTAYSCLPDNIQLMNVHVNLTQSLPVVLECPKPKPVSQWAVEVLCFK